MTAVFAFVAMMLALGAVFFAAHAEESAKDAGATSGAVTVSLTEFALSPQMINAPVGGSVLVTNNGTVDHNFAIVGTDLKTKMLKPGESETLDLGGVEPGAYDVLCQVGGHSGAGMTGMLHLGSASTSADSAENKAANDKSDAVMKAPVDAYVAQLTEGANTKGVGNQPLAPKVSADGTKEFT